MIFTPQRHAAMAIRSTELNYNQQTGTVAHENQRAPVRIVKRNHRKGMLLPASKDIRIDIEPVKHSVVTNMETEIESLSRRAPRAYKLATMDVEIPEANAWELSMFRDLILDKIKERPRYSKWGESKKDWRQEPRHHKGSIRRALNGTYDLRKELERTAHALREWREDVDPNAGMDIHRIWAVLPWYDGEIDYAYVAGSLFKDGGDIGSYEFNGEKAATFLDHHRMQLWDDCDDEWDGFEDEWDGFEDDEWYQDENWDFMDEN